VLGDYHSYVNVVIDVTHLTRYAKYNTIYEAGHYYLKIDALTCRRLFPKCRVLISFRSVNGSTHIYNTINSIKLSMTAPSLQAINLPS
jgi:hypothetical protein